MMEPFDLLIGAEDALISSAEGDAYERYMLRAMLLAYINSSRKAGRCVLNADFLKWYASNADFLGVSIPQLDADAEVLDTEDYFSRRSFTVPIEVLRRNRLPAPAASPLQQRLEWVGKTLDLDLRDAMILGTIYRLSQVRLYCSFAMLLRDGHSPTDEVNTTLIASILGLSERELLVRFGVGGALRRLGLLEDRRGGDFAPSAMLVKLMEMDTVDLAALEHSLLGQPRVPQLKLADFDHLGSAVGDVVTMLDGAFTKSETGINILFHGDPGTGKTELATLLASLCNAHVVFAGEMDEGEAEPSRSDRLAHLSFLSALGQRIGRTIVVVDEAEDIFAGVDTGKGSERRGSKVFLNRLVERSVIPTIWITNHPDRLGEAVLRRMTWAVEFRKPGIVVRRRIIDRHASTLDLSLDAASRDRLAQVPVAPAIIASALKAASLGCTRDDARVGKVALASALSIHKAMTHSEITLPSSTAIGFNASLSSADVDLVALEERVVAAGATALSFLFTGLPGSGKSAFARHLAGRLGMEVLEKRGSDLLGMFVGQTETNIAEAFREARDNRMFLIFDEADSLLADRRHAVRSWEVSQVNEMLTWMERHPLPFAATSNLPENLDPAVQRRFLFKARFSPMTKPQIAKAFRGHFGCEAPAGALKLAPLAPGDFVVVARKASILQVTDAATLAEMLKAEVALKPDAGEPIGFL